MFGISRKQPIELVPFAQDKPRTFTTLLCDGFAARNVPSLDSLIAELRPLQAAHPAYRVLASLDDLGQAGYTSGHTIGTHSLDDSAGHDLTKRDAAAFEGGEHLGYLSTISEFPIRLANLLKRAEGTSFADAAGLLFWSEPGKPNDLVSANREPDAALELAKEEVILVQLVPVSTGAATLAAFPNGYFTCDLNPLQNYAVALHLERTYGLVLFGVGSRFLGFWRDRPLDQQSAAALASELAALYAEVPDGSSDALTQVLTGKDRLLLRYTET